MANAMRNLRSLYFVVSEEIIIPNPRVKQARMKIRTGKNKAYILGLTSVPFTTKYIYTIIKTPNCINILISRL